MLYPNNFDKCCQCLHLYQFTYVIFIQYNKHYIYTHIYCIFNYINEKLPSSYVFFIVKY